MPIFICTLLPCAIPALKRVVPFVDEVVKSNFAPALSVTSPEKVFNPKHEADVGQVIIPLVPPPIVVVPDD